MTPEYPPGIAALPRAPQRACPYIGLQPYNEADSDYFFGRDADRDLIIANLMASRLTILYGPSGVGKSSLLQAGVLPHLRHSAEGAFSYVASSETVVVYHASWRDDPLVDLTRNLREALPRHCDPELLVPAGPLSVDILRAVADRLDADIYLLCDQFEEEALYQDGAKAEAFAAELGRIVGAAGLRVNVLLGVREDALAKLDRLEAYIPELFSNGLRLDHLTAQGAREAIERPLAKYSDTNPEHPIAIEPGLVVRLLDELRTGHVLVSDARGSVGLPSQTIETPFLQLVMTKLWFEEASRGSRTLRESTLSELGGSGRIVRTHLDDVMGQLTESQRRTAADVFRYLVTPSGAKIAHTADDLAAYAGMPDSTELRSMLEELASSRERVLRPVPPPVDEPGPPRYEIFHDVMAPAVLDWRRRYVALQDQIAAEAAAELARHEAEIQRRRLRWRFIRSRVLPAVLALLLVAAVAVVVYAKRVTDEAVAGQYLADYDRLLPSDPASALHAALGSWHKRHSAEAQAAVSTALVAENHMKVMRPDSGIAWSSEFSPNGRTMITAGNSGAATMFDTATGRRLLVIRPAHGHAPLSAASFSPDGAMVATAANDGAVRVYATTDGRTIGALTEYGQQVYLAWVVSSGRELLLISSYGNELRPAVLWDPQRAVVVARYGTSEKGAIDANASPDGTKIVAVDVDASATVWDALSARVLAHSPSLAAEFPSSSTRDAQAAFPHFVTGTNAADRIAVLGHSSDTSYLWKLMMWDWGAKGSGGVITGDSGARLPVDLAVSHNARLIAMVADKRVVVYDATSSDFASVVGGTAGQPDGVVSVEFSADDQRLLTANVDGHGRVWLARAFDGTPIASFVGHRGQMMSAHFDPADPTKVTSAGLDGTARVWTFNIANQIHPDSFGWVVDVGLSPDGKDVLTGQDTGYYDVWDVNTYRHIKGWSIRKATHGGMLLSAQFMPDGDHVLTATYGDTEPHIWNWHVAESSKRMQADAGQSLSSRAALSPDGTRIAVGDWGNRVVEWDAGSGDIVGHSAGNSGGYVISLTYVPHSHLLVAASTDGSVQLWDAAHLDRAPVRTLAKAGSVPTLAVAASTDGKWVGTVDSNHVIHIWRTADWHAQQPISGPPSTMRSLAFSPSGDRLAAAAADSSVYIFDWKSQHLLATLQRHGDGVNSVRFTTDTRLLTGSDDGTAASFTCQTCESFASVLAEAEQLDHQ